jgi:hypothetical protein
VFDPTPCPSLLQHFIPEFSFFLMRQPSHTRNKNVGSDIRAEPELVDI